VFEEMATVSEVQVTREGAGVRAVLAGSLDGETAARVRSRLKPLLKEGPRSVLFDLGSVSYVDRSGVDSLVHAARIAHRLGGEVTLARCPDQVRKMLAALGYDQLFAYQ